MKQRTQGLVKRAPLAVGTLDIDTRAFDVVASTDARDSHGDSLEQDWDLAAFKANPVVFFSHDQRGLPIGSAEDVRVEDGQLKARIKLVSAAANPLAEQVMHLMKEGAMRGVSVGFVPGKSRVEKRNGRDVRVLSKNELLEISMVGIPANAEAMAKSESSSEDVKRMNTKTHKALDLSENTSNEHFVDKLDEMVGKMLALTETKTFSEAIARIDSLKIERDAHAAKAARVEGLEAQIAEHGKLAAKAAIDAEVQAGVDARKVSPAKRAEFAAKAHEHDAAWTKALVEALPVLVGAEPPPKPAATGEEAGPHGLTKNELAICAESGCEPATFAMLKARRAASPTS